VIALPTRSRSGPRRRPVAYPRVRAVLVVPRERQTPCWPRRSGSCASATATIPRRRAGRLKRVTRQRIAPLATDTHGSPPGSGDAHENDCNGHRYRASGKPVHCQKWPKRLVPVTSIACRRSMRFSSSGKPTRPPQGSNRTKVMSQSLWTSPGVVPFLNGLSWCSPCCCGFVSPPRSPRGRRAAVGQQLATASQALSKTRRPGDVRITRLVVRSGVEPLESGARGRTCPQLLLRFGIPSDVTGTRCRLTDDHAAVDGAPGYSTARLSLAVTCEAARHEDLSPRFLSPRESSRRPTI